jgi:hypothetical protein
MGKPVELNWLVEGQLFHVVFPAALDTEIMRDYDSRLLQELGTAQNKLHFIADLSGVKVLPPVNVLVSLRHPYHQQLGRGLTVGLTRNPVARFLIAMGTQLAGVNHRDFNTFNEARAYLNNMEGI